MSCGPRFKVGTREEPKSLAELIVEYQRAHQFKDEATRSAYVNQLTSDEDACLYAGQLRVLTVSGRNWKRHPHFNRGWLNKEPFNIVLRTAASRLVSNASVFRKIAKSKGFSGVHDLVGELVQDIKGLGPLAVYDMTTLLGHRFGFRPDVVYLHAGTLEGAEHLFGARNISPEHRLSATQKSRLEPLEADEMEDFLCIYKRQLRYLRSRRSLPDWSFP